MPVSSADVPSTRHLAELFLRSPVATLLVAPDTGLVTGANQASEVLLGHAPSALRAMRFEELDVTTEDGGISVVGRVQYRTLRTRDGVDVDVEMHVVSLGPPGSSTLAVFARDVREERHAERDRIRLQSQLWMAQKHEAVGRLAAGLAHDFNNLLATVTLTAESLRERLGPMEFGTVADMDVILDAGRRARDLTRQLLAFSGRQAMSPRPVSMNQMVEGMRELLRRTLPEDIELAIRPSSGAAAVNADPSQIEQVLLNLVVNAREAMPSGGDLMIQVHEVDLDADFARDYVSVEPGPHVMLSVTDTGVGMDTQTQFRIFEPFFTTRDQGRGHGLGLATVYGIVKQSGGSIWVTSDPGLGSTFRIYLPRVPASGVDGVARAQDEAPEVVGGSEHILVVEDEETVRVTTARILRELGYMVTEARSPGEAMRVVADPDGPHPVDAVLTDVVMPGMSGMELAGRLHERWDGLPVLYMTGYQEPGWGDREGEAVGPLLNKPFTRAELARQLREVLGGGAEA